MSTWTTRQPNQPGWYWLLNPCENQPLPVIVQVTLEWQTGRWLALVPASIYPRTSGMILDLQEMNAMWAGPVHIPSLLALANQGNASGSELSSVLPHFTPETDLV